MGTLRKWVRNNIKFPMLTCYDATTAKWLYRAGLRTVLVGDTAAQMILGYDSTLPAPMDFMVQITAAVKRGEPHLFVMADMPFGSYQASTDEAVTNAIRFLKEAQADSVKLEVDAADAPLVERLSRAGVPVVAHIGSRPQQVRAMGGFKSQGRTRAEADRVIETADALLRTGASMLLIEAVPAEVSEAIVRATRESKHPDTPVIGCGAGPACDGHVVVLHDLLGLTDWQPPFAKPQAKLGEQVMQAATNWKQLIESGDYLRDDHPYHMMSD